MADNSGGLRTPLGRVRFLGAARNGTGEAWLMHVTSLALVPLTLYLVWLVLDLIVSGLVHMEVGMRSIIVDYVQGHARAWALVANACFAALLALACVYA